MSHCNSVVSSKYECFALCSNRVNGVGAAKATIGGVCVHARCSDLGRVCSLRQVQVTSADAAVLLVLVLLVRLVLLVLLTLLVLLVLVLLVWQDRSK